MRTLEVYSVYDQIVISENEELYSFIHHITNNTKLEPIPRNYEIAFHLFKDNKYIGLIIVDKIVFK